MEICRSVETGPRLNDRRLRLDDKETGTAFFKRRPCVFDKRPTNDFVSPHDHRRWSLVKAALADYPFLMNGGLWVVLNLLVAKHRRLNDFWGHWMDGKKTWWQSVGLGALVFVCGFSLVMARFYIVLEAFVSLREMPASAYQTQSGPIFFLIFERIMLTNVLCPWTVFAFLPSDLPMHLGSLLAATEN